MKKTLSQTGFHEVVAAQNVNANIVNGKNQIIFTCKQPVKKSEGDCGEDRLEDAPIATDLIDSIDLYVRIIFNVQLLNFNTINEFTTEIADKLNTFEREHLGAELFNKLLYDHVQIRSTGPIYKSPKGDTQITSWISIDIPYIQTKLEIVNTFANDIISIYKNYCSLNSVTGRDVFYNAKYVAIPNLSYKENVVSILLASNGQKPNAYTECAEVHMNLPSDVKINKKNLDQIRGCKIIVNDGNDNSIPWKSEIIFDESIKFSEITIYKLVQKDESLIVSHFTSRSISIFKKEKGFNQFLFNYSKDGKLKINPIKIIFFEHPKAIGVVSEIIESFMNTTTVLNVKSIKMITDLTGKHLISKLNAVYN